MYVARIKYDWVTRGDMPHWNSRAPAIDLRTIPQMSARGGTPRGFAFAAFDRPPALREGETDLGRLDRTGTDELLRRLGQDADPAGLTAPKPLMPKHDLMMEMWLNGEVIWDKPLKPKLSAEWAPVLAGLHEQYRIHHARSQPTGSDYYRRVLMSWCEKYGFDTRTGYRLLIPSGYQDETPLPHGTSISDNFPYADGPLADNADWTELGDRILTVVSNQVQVTDTLATPITQHQTALASSDHFSQIDAITINTPSTARNGISGIVRLFKDGSGIDGYLGGITVHSTLGDRKLLQKVVNDVFTNLEDSDESYTAPDTPKAQADGDTIKFFLNAVEKISVTDTAVAGNNNTGILVRRGASAQSDCIADNFSAGDLAAAVTAGPLVDRVRLISLVDNGLVS